MNSKYKEKISEIFDKYQIEHADKILLNKVETDNKVSFLYIYKNDYYSSNTKLEILNNKYFIRRFKYKNEILYVYHKYTINYSTQLFYSSDKNNSVAYRNYIINSSTLYNLLNAKYN